jgi:hypothetical protein
MLSVNWIGQVVNGSLRPLITCDRREPKMTVSKLTTLADYIADAERKYDKVAEESGFKSDYALGCLRGLQLAAKASDIRTEVETAVIDAAGAGVRPRRNGSLQTATTPPAATIAARTCTQRIAFTVRCDNRDDDGRDD